MHVGVPPTAMTRFSINCILWFGEDLQAIKGEVPSNEEEFMPCIYPTRLEKQIAS